jgi:hypothetical protein
VAGHPTAHRAQSRRRRWQTARLDYLFDSGTPSVGIGDGGNEIGMGNLAEIIPT